MQYDSFDQSERRFLERLFGLPMTGASDWTWEYSEPFTGPEETYVS